MLHQRHTSTIRLAGRFFLAPIRYSLLCKPPSPQCPSLHVVPSLAFPGIGSVMTNITNGSSTYFPRYRAVTASPRMTRRMNRFTESPRSQLRGKGKDPKYVLKQCAHLLYWKINVQPGLLGSTMRICSTCFMIFPLSNRVAT